MMTKLRREDQTYFINLMIIFGLNVLIIIKYVDGKTCNNKIRMRKDHVAYLVLQQSISCPSREHALFERSLIYHSSSSFVYVLKCAVWSWPLFAYNTIGVSSYDVHIITAPKTKPQSKTDVATE